MAQHFNEDVSAERLSTVSDVVYPRPEPEYVGHGAEVPPDVRPPEHYPSPVSAETGRSNAAQQGRPTNLYIKPTTIFCFITSKRLW